MNYHVVSSFSLDSLKFHPDRYEKTFLMPHRRDSSLELKIEWPILPNLRDDERNALTGTFLIVGGIERWIF